MSLAFGAMQPLAVAAAALSHGLLVAAAGVVVVVAIVLVFVMVLRGAGSSRRKASGLGYDPQRGQMGQPHNPAGDAGQAGPWNQGRQADPYGAGDQGYGQGGGFDQGYGQGGGFDQGGYGQRQGGGQPGWDQPAPASAGAAWGAPGGGQPQWNDPMPGVGQPASQNDWGAPQPNPQWNAPAGGGQQWNNAPAAATRPGAGAANPWDAPQPASAWEQQPAPQAPNQGAWNAQPPANPSQPAWGQQPDPMSQPTVQRGGPRGGAPRLSERKTDGTGREFDLRKDRLTIGRHRESDVFLEDLAVSRLNTTISHDASGAFILKDENSANGTYVNGERITEHVLQDGDEVQVGQTTLIFHQ